MKILVRGLGNVGTTLANLCLAHRDLLGVDVVHVEKQLASPWLEADLAFLEARGAVVHRRERAPAPLDEVDYVFDCRAAGMPRADRDLYEALPRLRGVSAQGTELGFGVPYVLGVNDEAIAGARFVHVASCNTHALSSLLRAFAGPHLDALVDADFVVARRAEDLGSHERLVSGTVVARHREVGVGTHHATDLRHVFATVGLRPAVTSSDVTTPSQLLHTVRFSLRLDPMPDADALEAAVTRATYLATTKKLDAARVFELGRRYGAQGRLYAHAVVVSHDLLVTSDAVRGWAFVPQEGNTLLSTLASFLLQTDRPGARDAIVTLSRALLLRAL
ncbi:MAG: hypothetical protein KF901_13990 [Myxococcales bacterium]|nr:hypothetical protein [Myxococcales bacterium]